LNENIYNISGYSFESCCRESKLGGGVSLYVNENEAYRLHPELKISSDVLECIFVEILKHNFLNVIIDSIYRPPNRI